VKLITLFAIEWNLNPELFRIGSFALSLYQLMFVLSFGAGVYFMRKIYQSERQDEEQLDWLLIAMIIGTVLGARIGHYAFYDWQEIFKNPIEVFLPIQLEGGFKFVGFRGLASHGAVFGILTALWLFSRKFKQPFLWITDRIAIPTAFAAIFIRLGNFFNHEIVGAQADVPWAVKFKYHTDQLPRHPSQIYESLSYLSVFLVLGFLYRKYGRKTPHGLLFGVFMTLIFGYRFILEFLKAAQNDNDTGILESVGLNIGQLLSIPMVLVGLYFWFIHSRKKGRIAMEEQIKNDK